MLDREYYIFVYLSNPQAFERVVDGIMNAVEKLGDFLEDYPLLDDELLYRLGL